MINFQKKVLPNGLRVIAAPMENTEAATLLVLVGVGSRYETKEISGVSHFLEHLFFKGTKSRPKAGQIHKELDRIGASHNAFTSEETTGFWVKTSAKDFEISLDIVSDILLNSLFKGDEIEKEREVILQEINMYEDEPRRKVWDILENVLYKDQPIGRDVLGAKESISKINRSDIVGYKTANYLSRNMVIAAAGNLDAESVFVKIDKFFGKVKKGKNKPPVKASVLQKTLQLKIVEKESDQTHLAMAFRGYDRFDERRYALNLLSVILGGNASSKLFREIREKLGLAYYVFALGDQALDCGYLGIGAGVAHNELDRTVRKIMEISGIIKTRGVFKEELRAAKSFVAGQTALSLETSDDIANFLAGQELFYGRILQPEDILKKIEKVSQNDIIGVAREIFTAGKLNLAVIGSQKPDETRESLYKKLFLKL